MKKTRIPLEKLKNINRTHLLIAALFGVLLLVIALPVDKEKESAKKQSSETALPDQTAPEEVQGELSYQKQLEQQLAQVLSEMEGVGKVAVMITWKDGGETQVEKDVARAEENSAESDGQGNSRQNGGVSLTEETVYQQGEGSVQTPFVKKITLPQVEGVLVVAQGAGNPSVVKNISDAIMALFPVEAHKIKVVRKN